MSHIKALAYNYVGEANIWKLDQPLIMSAIGRSDTWNECLSAFAGWQARRRAEAQRKFNMCLLRASTLLTEDPEQACAEIRQAQEIAATQRIEAETASQKYFHKTWKEVTELARVGAAVS